MRPSTVIGLCSIAGAVFSYPSKPALEVLDWELPNDDATDLTSLDNDDWSFSTDPNGAAANPCPVVPEMVVSADALKKVRIVFPLGSIDQS